MSSENIQEFVDMIQADNSLFEKLIDSDMDQFLEIAKEKGFEFTEADLLRYQANASLGLSDDQLSEVLGGRLIENRDKRIVAGTVSGAVAAGWATGITVSLLIIK